MDLLPFCVRQCGTPFVIPLGDNGSWLTRYDLEPYWKKAESFYKAHKGAGNTTPVTLTQRLNHQNALFAQSKNSPPLVVYNSSGSRLYASILKKKMLIDSSLYSIVCKSNDEAYFLTGLINSSALQTAFSESKKSPRHYHTYYWNNIPIPKFNRHNNNHRSVASIAQEAHLLANRFLKKNNNISRKAMLKAIQNDGILTKVDRAVATVLPQYVN